MCDTNKDGELIRECFDVLQPDVAVLQEARPEHIDLLRQKFPFVATARDAIYGDISSHLVIASHLKLSDVTVISHSSGAGERPSWLAKVSRLGQFLDTLSATISDDDGREIRVSNLHTSAYASPTVRDTELEKALKQIPTCGPCIVAGDFNSFAHPTLSWFMAIPLGFSVRDLLRNEYADLIARMKTLGFEPSTDQITYPRFRFRTDQVFRRNIPLKNSYVSKENWGSDHRPLVVELN